MLEAIRDDMGALDPQSLDNYAGHLDAGEDALAWHVLVMAADAHTASADIWVRLLDAAAALELEPDDEIYGDTVRLAIERQSR
jgi:hypothetical protein